MLDELIKTMDYGVSYGSGALKALQNDNLPVLDLLVREAIQNSSDAAIGVKGKRFDVKFNVRKFCPARFNKILRSLAPVLDNRHPEEQTEFLEIRDTRTSGLTGPVRLADLNPLDHGNYFKLVFDTGKEQTASSSGEAGGSWGYGKSVYYRVGIGLVVFYSQISAGDGYEERLIVSLMEHEAAGESLLREICSDPIGRAWWGKRDPQNEKELLPLTDPQEIQEILDIFGLERFDEGQTGTSIIIPYIDKAKMLEGIIPDDCGISDDEKSLCIWKDSVEKYLELAVEKWYAPKIFNKNLSSYSDQKWLAVWVNGNAVDNTNGPYGMRPLFQLVQELYTTALSYNAGQKYESSKFEGIECVSVPSNKVEGGKSGHVAFVRISQDKLSQGGNMLRPYIYLRLFNRSVVNDPIVMFARTPGLVLDYKVDGKWAKGLSKPESDDEYIFAFYVPNCNLHLVNKEKVLGEFAGKSFGEYLRKCEKSDHMEWDDKSGLTIVANLKNQMVSKINNKLNADNEAPVEGTTSKLAGKLGHRLLPKLGFGKSVRGGGSGNSGGGGSSDNLTIELKPRIKADCMEISYTLTFKNARKAVTLGLFVETETGVMDANAWEEDIDSTFPIRIERIDSVYTYAVNSKSNLPIIDICNTNNRLVNSDYTIVELLTSKSGSNISGFRVTNTITNAVVYGTLVIKASDRKYVCAIKEVKD